LEYSGIVHYLFRLKSYESIRREVLYNILIEFGILVKLIWLIKMFEQNL